MTEASTVHEFPEKSGSASNRTARVLADRAAGEAYVASVCFKHGPPRLTGVELEFTVHHADDPARPLDPDLLATALGPHTPRTLRPDSPATPLPAGSPVSLEPGVRSKSPLIPRPRCATSTQSSRPISATWVNFSPPTASGSVTPASTRTARRAGCWTRRATRRWNAGSRRSGPVASR